MLEDHEFTFRGVESFNVLAHGLICKNKLFDVLDGGFDVIEYRKIAIDHRIHQRVENVAGAVAQKLRLMFTARTHISETAFGPRTHREHIFGASKNTHFTDVELTVIHLDEMKHHE